MRAVRLCILALALGAAVFGCRKQQTGTQTAGTGPAEGTGKETAMGITIQWLGHASFRIRHEDQVIYIDPWKLKDSPHDATYLACEIRLKKALQSSSASISSLKLEVL